MMCFALDPKNMGCEILKYKRCKGLNKCSFYKTHDQIEKQRKKAAEDFFERTGLTIEQRYPK